MSDFMIKYHTKKPYDNLQVWNLDILKVPNPSSHAYKDEVFFTKRDYNYVKECLNGKDGEVITSDGFKWMVTEAKDTLDAIDIFRKKLQEEESK